MPHSVIVIIRCIFFLSERTYLNFLEIDFTCFLPALFSPGFLELEGVWKIFVVVVPASRQLKIKVFHTSFKVITALSFTKFAVSYKDVFF